MERSSNLSTFNELGLSKDIIRAVVNMGFEETTPIQEQTIPVALEGKDLIGQAQTGTGKTAAYGIPLIEKINKSAGTVQGLVLAPTRELAIQVAEELNKIGQFRGIHTLPIYGGQDIVRQIKALQKRPHIVVATPGRLMDHMRRRTVRLQDVSMLILDEADEMLNMGFVEDIETILQEVPEERQTLLFSATMPLPIQVLARKFMTDPQVIAVKSKEVTVANIEQIYFEVNEQQKFDVFCRLLDVHAPEAAIVFGRTKKRVDEMTEALNKRGYSAEGIHGDLTQAKRDSVLRQFREGTIEILVATDVAARGLDISGVTHVYNFDIPQDPESYVHRIGRTGRAGKTGMAVTFVVPREMGHLRMIERQTKRTIIRQRVPSMNDVLAGQQRLAVEKIVQVIQEGSFGLYRELAEELLNEHDSVALVSAALKLLTKEPDVTPVRLTESAPLRSRRSQEGNFPRSGGRNPSSGFARERSSYHTKSNKDRRPRQ